jgi:hypothetical protein
VVRWVSEGSLLKSRTNKIDMVILAVFFFTFVFMCLTESKMSEEGEASTYDILIETDDFVVIAVIFLRYTAQIWQMVRTLRNTQKNMAFQKKMKDIDLNKTPQTSVVDEHNE